MKQLQQTRQKFTLIEVIAVLLILGILAAVAVPKYVDLAQTSEVKACEGIVSNFNGHENMLWSKLKLNGTYAAGSEQTLIGDVVAAGIDPNSDYVYVSATGKIHYGDASSTSWIGVTRTASTDTNPGYWTITSRSTDPVVP